MTTTTELPIKNVRTIVRLYAKRVIEAPQCAVWISQLYAPDESLPTCKHGLYTGTLVFGAPACPLCMVDHGYGVEP